MTLVRSVALEEYVKSSRLENICRVLWRVAQMRLQRFADLVGRDYLHYFNQP